MLAGIGDWGVADGDGDFDRRPFLFCAEQSDVACLRESSIVTRRLKQRSKPHEAKTDRSNGGRNV